MSNKWVRFAALAAGVLVVGGASAQWSNGASIETATPMARVLPPKAMPCQIVGHGFPLASWVDLDSGRAETSAGLVIRDPFNYIVVNGKLPTQSYAACLFNNNKLERIWIATEEEYDRLSKLRAQQAEQAKSLGL